MNTELNIIPEIAELLPPLSDAELSGLETDILQRGVISPLVVWNDVLVDGHHRYHVCQKHSLPFPVKRLEFDSVHSAKLWAWRHQENRRNLTPFQRIEIALQFKPAIREKAKENQRLSEGRGKKGSATLQNLNPIETAKEIAEIADVSEGTLVKAEYIAAQADETTKQKLRAGHTTINAEYKRLRKKAGQEERQRQKEVEPLIPTDDRLHLVHSSVSDAVKHIEKESVDFIITDPPYPKEYLDVYQDLARFAEHALRSGGSLLCMVGQSYLPEMMNRLQSDELHYHWTLAYLTPGGQAAQLWERNVNTFWKPVLWFVKGKYTSHWVGDAVHSKTNDNDKEHHHWGQSESGMFDLLDRFVLPNQTVCDPFCGGGTTGIAALKLKCRFIGCDIDSECVTKTQRRLSTYLQNNA